MARTPAAFPEGTRLTDFVTLGVIAKEFPRQRVNEILEETGKASKRHRALPANVVMYYVIALALFMQVSYGEVLRCLLEGLRWLRLDRANMPVAGRSGISKARSRLGVEPVRRLHDETVRPVAVRKTRGAWYRDWRVVSLDGSTLDTADTEDNALEFGRPGASRGASAFPKLRFVSLVENGTHVLFGSVWGPYSVQEATLTEKVLPNLEPGMLCLADRNFHNYRLWKKAKGTGAQLVWRVKRNARLDPLTRFSDGSYTSKIYPTSADRKYDRHGITVRVVDYRLKNVSGSEPVYRIITTILEPEEGPADELAALYHERWEIETAFDELKTHLRGAQIVLRSKRPDLVVQEFYGLLMAHFAVRSIMHEAALKADIDPDQLSFTHSVRVLRRKVSSSRSFFPSGSDPFPQGGSCGNS